jgi:hypothetical protein
MRRTSPTLVVLALAGVGGCEWFANEGAHGIAIVELRAHETSETDVFAQTGRAQIIAKYGACLRDFYAREPQWTFDGDEGERLFDGVALDWRAALCDGESLDVPMACDVFALEQIVGDSPRLLNEYTVEPPLQYHELAVGPLPAARLAECEEGSPTVIVESVVGKSAEGEELWRASIEGSVIARVDDPRPVVAVVGGPAERR